VSEPGYTDTDLGLKKILSEMKSFRNSAVKVGVLEGATESDGTPMALIAAVHEYGSKKRNIPQRSFVRGWVDDSKSQINSTVEKLMARVSGGTLTAQKALKTLGVFGVGGIKAKIKRGPFTPLSRRKGTPLIDTGQLRNSINYEVIK
jgi:hypothetical protein